MKTPTEPRTIRLADLDKEFKPGTPAAKLEEVRAAVAKDGVWELRRRKLGRVFLRVVP